MTEMGRPGFDRSTSPAGLRPVVLPRPGILVALGLLALFVIGISTLRPGHPWTGDFAQYIAHAANIVEGRGYHDTRYIYNPEYPEVGPPSYPWLTPLVLATVYRLFGLDWWAMKSALYAFWVASLALVYLLHARALDPWRAILLTAVVAASPYFWQLREQIGAEFPFLVFLYASLLVMDTDAGGSRPRRAAKILAQAVLFFLCYATRTVGIVLIPVLLFRELLHRRFGVDTLLTLSGFALLWLIHLYLFGGMDYHDQLEGITAFTIARNLALYMYMLWSFFVGYLYDPDLVRKPIRIVVGLAFTCLVALGYGAKLLGFADHGRVRLAPHNAGVIEIFTAGYLVMISIPPFTQAPRYMVPLFPLLVRYAYDGMLLLLRPLTRSSRLQHALIIAAVVAVFAVGHANLSTYPRGTSVTDPEPTALFAYVREQTPEDALLVFTRPRIMGLLGGRRTTIWPYHERFGEDAAWCYFEDVGATHVVIHDHRVWSPLPPYLERDRLDSARHLRPAFDNGAFVVYEILEFPACGEREGPSRR